MSDHVDESTFDEVERLLTRPVTVYHTAEEQVVSLSVHPAGACWVDVHGRRVGPFQPSKLAALTWALMSAGWHRAEGCWAEHVCITELEVRIAADGSVT